MTRWSPAAERFFGWTEREVIGRPSPFAAQGDRPDLRALWTELENGRPFGRAEWSSRRKDGSRVDISVSATPIRNARGALSGVLVVVTEMTERRKIERALRESEQNYRLLFGNNPHPMWLYDLETLAFLEVNEAAIEKFGWSREEFLRMSLADIQVEEDRSRLRQSVDNLPPDGESRSLWRHRTRTGSRIDVEIISRPITFSGRRARLVLAHDVTERLKAEAALRKSEAQFRTICEEAPVGIFLCDAGGNDIYNNRESLRQHGYSDEEARGDGWRKAIHPDDRERVFREFEAAVRDGRNYEGVSRCLHPDGTIVWMDAKAAPIRDGDKIIGYVGMCEDITEFMKASQAVDRLASFPRLNPNPIFEFDDQGAITYRNEAAIAVAAATGLDDPAALLPAGTQAIVADCLATGAQSAGYETRCGDRALTWCFVPEPAGRRVIAFAFDISHRVDLENQLRQSQRLEAVGRLAGGVAHDFNNLLTVITGYCVLLLRRLGADDRIRREVLEIQKAGQRATSLTNQLLAYSRRQVLRPRTLDLNNVVADMDQMLRRVIGEDILLVTRTDPELGRVRADPGQLEQVIVNLAVNARDAMPRGGKLIVETHNADLDDFYARRHVGVRPGRYVRISISDTGAGMNRETRERVFEPFFTTKGQGKGTGLGLSTAYGIIKQSGGNIWAYSEPGIGTTFKIYLPRIDDAAEDDDIQEPRRIAPGGSETILVVEDEPKVRDLIVEILGSQGYTVLPASCGDEALEICRRHKGEIRLLLTDVVMPGFSGPEVATIVSRCRPGIRTIFMSGYTDDAIVHHGVIRDDVPFIQKPFSLDGLARKIREILDAPEREVA